MRSLLAVFLFGTLASMAWASGCTNMDKIKVMTQWREAYSSGQDRIDFGQAVYRTFFKINPGSLKLFHDVGGDDVTSGAFIAHTMRVLNGLEIVISLLDQPEALDAELSHLHQQHQERNLGSGYFDDFVKALDHVIPAQLGKCYDRDAWTRCMTEIASQISGH